MFNPSNEKDIAQLKAYISHLQVTQIAGAGHNIRRDQFSKYLEITQKTPLQEAVL